MDLRKEKRLDVRHDEFAHLSKETVEFDIPKHLNGESDEEVDRKLDAAIDELKDGQRECIRMFYFEKQSYEDIEAKTGYNYKEVKSFLQNGKRNLKIKLSSNDE